VKISLNKIIAIFFCIILSINLTGCISQNALNRELNKVPQNNLAFVQENQAKQKLISNENAAKLRVDYLKKFYLPWTDPFTWHSKSAIKNDLIKIINAFKSNPGWDANQNLHTKFWAENIELNLNLGSFPNKQHKAITVRITALRVLPTDSPSFSDWDTAGKGYPFDNMQTAYLGANIPLYILHTTFDKQWDLVITPYNCYGWIKSLDLATVDNEFIDTWRQHRYITALQDEKPLLDLQQRYRTSTEIGAIFPLIKTTPLFYHVLTAICDTHGKAQAVTTKLSRKTAQIWPLELTQQNIASLANNFLGNPYGWGDLYNYRDCSETMRSLFAPFAIWLPRNSEAQAKTGKFISLKNLDNEQKRNLIIKLGKPFTTLIWMPGHIMLYVGEKNDKIYAFHNPWGIHTVNYLGGKSGRAVIGRTVITPLDIGKNYANTEWVYLDLVEGISILV